MKKTVAQKIGITMRVVEDPVTGEQRDCLAQDWAEFMAFSLPKVMWVPVPNVGKGVADFIKKWDLQGVILSGGNDIGSSPLRERTEQEIMAWGMKQKMPIFGVCRGLQFIHAYFQGTLAPCPSEQHVAKEHPVFLIKNFFCSSLCQEMVVNSYHRYGIPKEHLPKALIPLAMTEDGWIEALQVKEHSIFGVMWHPERGRPFRSFDGIFIRHCFGWDGRLEKVRAR